MVLPAPLPAARRVTRLSLPLVGAFVVGAIAYGGLYTFPAPVRGLRRGVRHQPDRRRHALDDVPHVTAVASPLLGRAYDEFADRDLLTASMTHRVTAQRTRIRP